MQQAIWTVDRNHFGISNNRLSQRYSQLLGVDLYDAKVEANAFAQAMCSSRQATAIATGNTILLGEGFHALDSQAKQFILAHEYAHLAQKKNGLRKRSYENSDSTTACETEANHAATRLVSGQRFTCNATSEYEKPMAWGCVGHFWSVWLAYLNAGEDDKIAFKTALFSWMPDQVLEFDAKHLYIDATVKSFSMRLAASSISDFDTSFRTLGLVESVTRQKTDYYEKMHRGLHCLTGGDSGAETRFRTNVLSNTTMNLLLRGMAHHSFGDSFAHRVIGSPGKMYPVGSGHGPHSAVGKDPDKVSHEKAGKNYLLYMEALQKVACARTGKQPTIPIQSLLQMLNPMLHPTCRVSVTSQENTKDQSSIEEISRDACGEDEKSCAEHLRKIAAKAMKRPMTRLWYDPIRDPKPWVDYYREHTPQIESAYPPRRTRGDNISEVLAHIQKQVSNWSTSPRK